VLIVLPWTLPERALRRTQAYPKEVNLGQKTAIVDALATMKFSAFSYFHEKFMRIVVLLLCLVVAVPTWGVVDTTYIILGRGTRSCGEVVDDYRNQTTWVRDHKFFYSGWISGYITAYNLLRRGKKDWSKDSDYAGHLLFVINYCKEHPLEKFEDGVKALMTEFDSSFGSKLIE